MLAAQSEDARVLAAVQALAAGLHVADAQAGLQAPRAGGAVDGAGEPLTPRELEVFELLAKGLANREIALALGISSHTAKFHVAQILEKTGAATRTEAVRQGLRMGWIGL
jgi:DNA-binding NarL/FixJ family response regulator